MPGLNKNILVIILSVFSFSIAFGQQAKVHIVKEKETIRAIALKYNITPYELLKANPEAVDPPKLGSKLVIPKPKKVEEAVQGPKIEKPMGNNIVYHKVKPKETLFSLSKLYKVEMDKIYEYNPALIDGLKIDMVLMIVKDETRDSKNLRSKIDTTKFLVHFVQPKETQWGLCHRYGISPKDLFDMNPNLLDGIKIGDTVLISKNLVTKIADQTSNYSVSYYEVQPKDTKYGISKKFSVNMAELERLNPAIVDGLKIGTLLAIPKIPKEVYNSDEYSKKTYTNLPGDEFMSDKEKINRMDNLETGRVLDVVLMLPFYLSENKDFLEYQNSNPERQKLLLKTVHKNKEPEIFNKSSIAFDFYNGALYALDSLKKLGLSVRLRVFDTERNIDKIKEILDNNDLSKADVVIGPLYTKNAEYVADRLRYDNVLVVSPLSKKHEIDGRYNLVQAMPSEFVNKNILLNKVVSSRSDSSRYLIFGGIADRGEVDFVKEKIFSYIDSNKVKVHIATENLIDRQLIVKMLKPKKDNVVLIASNSNVLVTDVLTALNTVRDSLPNRVFITNRPDVLDQLESGYLNNTHLVYPSDYFVDNNSSAYINFIKRFKEKNNYVPGNFALRGFDVTYDILLSIGSRKNAKRDIGLGKSRLLQGKFDYVRKPYGGYYNRGVFLIQYDNWKLKDLN